MSVQQVRNREAGASMSGMERLSLRVSEMINHPIAQLRRSVMIHKLDTDGEREWEEVMGVLSETNELDMTINDDGTITLKWEMIADEDRQIESDEFEAEEEPAPF
ncbi:hypothetical protein AQS70_20610 [Pseudomonas endophytica]|uniref:DUF1654 domain-containing protein n=2 Tax=Pseudomonas endophytica TaxID=1563157 RepID=A0A0Q0X4E9_9PSED|nr:hypothetical protein AQS70_20610 [Pseudomonas endophytica]